MTAAGDLASRLPGRTILVVGDVMLDHFVIGGVERISPEAPVPVVRFDHEEYRLGGAANVAHNAAALGGRASTNAAAHASHDSQTLTASAISHPQVRQDFTPRPGQRPCQPRGAGRPPGAARRCR